MLSRVIVFCKHNSYEATQLATDLSSWLHIKGGKALIIKTKINYQYIHTPIFKIPRNYQLAVVLGGDGTMLGAVRELVNASLQHIPILGVNLGGLGFLTALAPEELLPAMEQILAGHFLAPPRLMLHAQIKRQGEIIKSITALNDAVVNKATLARIINLSLIVNEQILTTFQADGLIISTPTGSTAYNLSAGGPICYPSLKCMLITPICSFALSNRPLLLSSYMTLTIILDHRAEDSTLTCDGQIGFNLLAGDHVIISQAAKTIRLILSPFKDYFEILRTKLRWG